MAHLRKMQPKESIQDIFLALINPLDQHLRLRFTQSHHQSSLQILESKVKLLGVIHVGRIGDQSQEINVSKKLEPDFITYYQNSKDVLNTFQVIPWQRSAGV